MSCDERLDIKSFLSKNNNLRTAMNFTVKDCIYPRYSEPVDSGPFLNHRTSIPKCKIFPVYKNSIIHAQEGKGSTAYKKR